MPLSDGTKSLLLKYIAGEASEEEIDLAEELLKNDPSVFKEFEQLWDLWYAVGSATNAFEFNVDDGWNSLIQRVGGNVVRKKKRPFHKKKLIIWGGSIVVAGIVLLGLLWYRSGSLVPAKVNRNEQQSLSFKDSRSQLRVEDYTAGPGSTEVKTLTGKHKQIQLPDGSKVWLDGNTSIRFTVNKKESVRMLYLSGQAFFDIKRQKDIPFFVKTKDALIRVLGTRFNVEAYPGDSTVETTLTSGSIMLTSKTGSEEVLRQIKPGEKATINSLSGRLEVQQVDTTFYTSWKEGKIIFSGQPFGAVAKAMEHKYNVSISFENPSLRNKKLNGYFDRESLKEALTALKLTLQFHYQINGDHVIISK